MQQIIDNINNFQEFESELINKKINTKGKLFEEFSFFIFKFHPFYKNFFNHIWLFNDIPPSHLEYLKIPSKDNGIDLVLVDKKQKYYAVQCKYRTNKDKTIPWSLLSTFAGLTFGTSDNFHKGIFITNCFNIHKNISNSSKIISIYGNFYDDLDEFFFDQIRSYYKLEPKIIPKNIIPRDYQKEIVKKTIEHFENNDRGYIEASCGSGKTLISSWIDDQMDNMLTIVLVPSLYLLSQFCKDWIPQKKNCNFILVGSDNNTNEVGFHNNGMILTTNENEILENLDSKMKTIIISTYQSSDKLINIFKNTHVPIDLCIFDEAHQTTGNVNKKFNQIIFDENIKIKKRLFMTATPKIYNGNNVENYVGMDNKKYYGDCIHIYNTGQAILNNYLCDYQIFTILIDDENIKKKFKNNEFVKVLNFDELQSHYLGSGICIMNLLKENQFNHLITYHNTVKNSKNFKILLEKLNEEYKLDFKIFQIDSCMSMKKRTNIVKEFSQNKKCILTSSKVLNEGVDIPIIDSVCFVDERLSTRDIIQCVGRSLRLYEGKEFAKIIIPVVLEEEYNDEKFSQTLRILKSLNQTDSRLFDFFTNRRYLHSNSGLINFTNYGNFDFTCDEIKFNEWKENIFAKLWDKINPWECQYEKLKIWIEENQGKLPSGGSEDIIEKKLGSFCSNQRKREKEGKLEQFKIEKLETFKLWYWSENDRKTFDEIFEDIKKFMKNNQNKLPNSYVTREERRLTKFCSSRRCKKKIGTLDESKIKKLESLPGWVWEQKPFFKSFNENFEELKIWSENNENKIPSSKSKNDVERRLGSFCGMKRGQKKKNKLSEFEIKKLETIKNWFWTDQNKQVIIKSFNEKFDDIKIWSESNKNKIPTACSKDKIEKKLGDCCARLRAQKKKGKLSELEIGKLETIKNWYWSNENY